MARRRPKAKASGGAPLWMTTFSDMMSLLLTFFILLFSMSSVSEDKFQAASQSLQNALLNGTGSGVLEGGNLVTEDEHPDGTSPEVPLEVQEMYEEVQEFVAENELGSTISLSRDDKGIYVDIKESILFASGQAAVKDQGTETLDLVGELLNKFNNRVIIEGYTDDVPVGNSKYSSNWELSVDRAVSVVRYLSEQKKVSPVRLSAVGYGEYRPVVPNDTAQNRARNRRVNIVLVHEPKEVKQDESNS